jgi:hypothetical protein
MADKSSPDPSILPLLAWLLSAAVLVFTACGTLEVGFESRTVVPTVVASTVEQVPFSASETPTPTPYDYVLPTPTPAVEGIPTTEAWTTYTNRVYRFSLRHPPKFDVPASDFGDPRGFIGDKIVFSVGESNPYWVGCLSAALGDCPVMEAVETTLVAGQEATRIGGYIGAIGGNIPQQYITYIVLKDEVYYTFTLYALSRDSAEQAGGIIWPLGEEDVAVFEQIMETLEFLEPVLVDLTPTAPTAMPPDSAPTETPWLITPTPTAPTPTPAKVLTPPGSAPTVTPVVENPLPPAFCRPDEAAMTLSATATTLGVGQVVTVKITLVNGETSNVRLGQPQYMLYVHPDVFSLDGMRPVEKPVTIEPGQSDEIEFALQATTPGRAMLMGSVSYEMHDLKYSWGSWSGCRTEPLEITVTQ